MRPNPRLDSPGGSLGRPTEFLMHSNTPPHASTLCVNVTIQIYAGGEMSYSIRPTLEPNHFTKYTHQLQEHTPFPPNRGLHPQPDLHPSAAIVGLGQTLLLKVGLLIEVRLCLGNSPGVY